MSGILDSRQRIMDTIVTLEGRKQIATGKLKVEYVSFTDSATFYSKDAISGSADPTNRIYFESCHLPQDQITFEADDSGLLKPFKNANNISIYGGKISNTETTQLFIGSSKEQTTYITGSQFASTSESLLASSIQNYKNLQVIGTKDFIFENDGFSTGVDSVEFLLSENKPISDEAFYARQINDLPSLFNDELFSNVLNFRHLPPVNKSVDTTVDKRSEEFLEKNKIGDYKRIAEFNDYPPVELENDLESFESIGYKKTIRFDPTSLNNKLLTQIFEVSDSEIKKLDIVDYGQYEYNGKIKHAFFVGKVLIDDNGTNSFVRLFTVVFE